MSVQLVLSDITTVFPSLLIFNLISNDISCFYPSIHLRPQFEKVLIAVLDNSHATLKLSARNTVCYVSKNVVVYS
jgi:hypothetical protein